VGVEDAVKKKNGNICSPEGIETGSEQTDKASRRPESAERRLGSSSLLYIPHIITTLIPPPDPTSANTSGHDNL
jgi:hypothetical protein